MDAKLAWVPIRGPLRKAHFLERPNRFLVYCRLQTGRKVAAHLPDPGRLKELLVVGREIWLRKAHGKTRKTRWTAVLVRARRIACHLFL